MPATVPPPSPSLNSCQRCPAQCCRLTVVLAPEDRVPDHLTTIQDGLPVMARSADGWCVALDRSSQRCSIYAQRPDTCRRFVMDGAYCRAIRQDAASAAPGNPITRQYEESA